MSIVGTAGDDVLTGTTGNDTFFLTKGGDDTASELDGDDVFNLGGALTAADCAGRYVLVVSHGGHVSGYQTGDVALVFSDPHHLGGLDVSDFIA